jgi:hypothetical protein
MLLFGFVAGALAVPLFHQMMLALLHAAHVTPRAPFAVQPTGPLGVPQVVSLTFWGGLWGIVFALVSRGFPRGRAYWVLAMLFGALLPTLVAWLVVLPLKGQPAGGRLARAGVITALLINAAWGLGTALFLKGFSRAGSAT